ncbi:MAG: glutamate racemase, partial [Defluviitoga tunisiensis]
IENAVKKVQKNDSVLLLATENTVKLGVYKELLTKKGLMKYEEKACPLFVPLIEEGYWYGQMADSVLRFYLRDYKSKYKKVILGCTHYPILEKQIKKYTNSLILDPADSIVDVLSQEVQLSKNTGNIKVNYYITGNVEKFETLSKAFMYDVYYKPVFRKIDLSKTKLYREKNLINTKQ